MKFQYEIEIEMLKAKLAKAREWIEQAANAFGTIDSFEWFDRNKSILAELDDTKGAGE